MTGLVSTTENRHSPPLPLTTLSAALSQNESQVAKHLTTAENSSTSLFVETAERQETQPLITAVISSVSTIQNTVASAIGWLFSPLTRLNASDNARIDPVAEISTTEKKSLVTTLNTTAQKTAEFEESIKAIINASYVNPAIKNSANSVPFFATLLGFHQNNSVFDKKPLTALVGDFTQAVLGNVENTQRETLPPITIQAYPIGIQTLINQQEKEIDKIIKQAQVHLENRQSTIDQQLGWFTPDVILLLQSAQRHASSKNGLASLPSKREELAQLQSDINEVMTSHTAKIQTDILSEHQQVLINSLNEYVLTFEPNAFFEKNNIGNIHAINLHLINILRKLQENHNYNLSYFSQDEDSTEQLTDAFTRDMQRIRKTITQKIRQNIEFSLHLIETSVTNQSRQFNQKERASTNPMRRFFSKLTLPNTHTMKEFLDYSGQLLDFSRYLSKQDREMESYQGALLPADRDRLSAQREKIHQKITDNMPTPLTFSQCLLSTFKSTVIMSLKQMGILAPIAVVIFLPIISGRFIKGLFSANKENILLRENQKWVESYQKILSQKRN